MTDAYLLFTFVFKQALREAFLSLDNMPPLHDITERETSGESAGKSATIALLAQLIGIIRKSDKTSGQIVSEQIQNSKFPLTDLVAIRKFCEIAGIKFDERIFRNRREFQMYFQSLLKENKRKEDWTSSIAIYSLSFFFLDFIFLLFDFGLHDCLYLILPYQI